MTTCAFISALGVHRQGIQGHHQLGRKSELFTPLSITTRRRTRTVIRITCSTKPPSSETPVPKSVPQQSDVSATQNAEQTDDNATNDSTDGDVPTPFGIGLRLLLTVLSLAGTVETLYLTYNKLFSSPGAICGTQGCLDVLSGPFSNFLGFPLSLYGSIAYLGFAYLSCWPILSPCDDSSNSFEEIYASRDRATRPLMLGLSTLQFTFSLYLVGLLKFVIQSMCPYCLLSAGLSASLFVLTAFVGRAVPKWRLALSISMASTTFAAIISSASFLVGLPIYNAAQPNGLQTPPAITAPSDQDAMRIAHKLKDKNSKMYGAFWCQHCYDQKQRFGVKAFSMLKYIECDKNGVNSQFQLCRDKRIPGYPTWEIDGELFPGEIEISELERLVDEVAKP